MADEEWTFLADEKVEVAGVAPKEERIVTVPPMTEYRTSCHAERSCARRLRCTAYGCLCILFHSRGEPLLASGTNSATRIALLNGAFQGEQLDARCPKCTGVVELTAKLTGTLYMTNYQLIFKEARIDDRSAEPRCDAGVSCPTEGEHSCEELKVPLALIDRVEQALENTASVTTKNFASYMFCFPTPVVFQSFMRRAQELIAGISRLDQTSQAFAFANREVHSPASSCCVCEVWSLGPFLRWSSECFMLHSLLW